ncbi:MAG: ABC transporter permease subunit [Gemmatimonadetes bacterium]|jgi:ABC-type transport system involved in multi-copper enzyme maturation permease subunit|nr:ABC transporter permease subunit [Gemmatimonadota bacterium]
MLWTIVRRELLDHLISLRFALLSILTLLLLTANGLVFSGEQRAAAVSRYNSDVRKADEELEQRCSVGLGHLAERGPGNLYRRPGRLFFCVAGRDQHIPSRIEGGTHSGHGWGGKEFNYSWHMPWNLNYHLDTPAQLNPVLPSFAELDWSFIIGMVASLMAVLLTYDAISGERQRGTLLLMMTNPIPRDSVLLGKFLAALLTVGLPLLTGLLISLLILHTGGRVDLDGADWGRLLLIVALSLVYVAVFVSFGLLISTWVRRPALGLLTLLLIWVLSVELIPGALGILGMHLVEPVTPLEKERESRELSESFYEKMRAGLTDQPSPSQAPGDEKILADWADLFNDFQERDMQIKDGAMDRQLRRVRFARQLTRLSPTALYRYALEGLAGTGFPHYYAFVQQTRRYRNRFVEFVLQEDGGDSDSPHVYFVKEGLSSEPVEPHRVPRFVDRFDFAAGLQVAAWDLVALVLLAVVIFLAAYLSFLRCDLIEA